MLGLSDGWNPASGCRREMAGWLMKTGEMGG